MKTMLLNSIVIFFIATAAMAEEQERNKKDAGSGFNMSIGFRSYYSWWDPVWSQVKASKNFLLYNAIGEDIKISNKADFLYNPIISFQFNDRWALSGSYSYGHYLFKTRFYAVKTDNQTIFKYIHNNDVVKHDADLLVNYSIKRWFKLVFGLKYQGYIIKNNIQSYSTAPLGLEIPTSDNTRFHSGGGGLGLAFVVPLGADFFFFPGFSGFVLVGKDFAKPSNFIISFASSILAGIDQRGSKTFVITGGIGSLSLAYYIRAIRLTIEAGGRCQYLYYTQTPRKNIAQRYDLFFGPFLGVSFSFL